MTGNEMMTKAAELLHQQEQSLGRKVGQGELIDLLYDYTDWPLPTCRSIGAKLRDPVAS